MVWWLSIITWLCNFKKITGQWKNIPSCRFGRLFFIIWKDESSSAVPSGSYLSQAYEGCDVEVEGFERWEFGLLLSYTAA